MKLAFIWAALNAQVFLILCIIGTVTQEEAALGVTGFAVLLLVGIFFSHIMYIDDEE